MQIKPYFESFTILKQIPIIKDDTGNEMNLTLIEAKLQNKDYELIESSYKFWRVLGKNQIQWGNKAISYDGIAYWRSKEKELLNITLENFHIQEVKDGFHSLFGESGGLRTTFKIKKVEE